MEPIVLAISHMCQNLNFINFGQIGQCFLEFGFFGDLTLAGLMIFSVFVAFIIRYNMPGNLIMPLGCALTYALYLISPAPHFLMLFILALIANGVLVVLGMMNYINR